jgi:hypothetical protein
LVFGAVGAEVAAPDLDQIFQHAEGHEPVGPALMLHENIDQDIFAAQQTGLVEQVGVAGVQFLGDEADRL